MKVFITPREKGPIVHLVIAHAWAKDESASSPQLVAMRVQLFCQDRGWFHYKEEKFVIMDYDRDAHRKKLCKNCELKAKASKRHGPAIENR